MKTESSALDDYLKRLAKELQALGPAETDDVVAEVRAHVQEAAGDDEGKVRGALAQLGEPETMAAGILAERGLVPAAGEIADAPTWRRLAAWIVDILVPGVLLVFVVPFGVLFLGLALFAGGHFTGSALAWIVMGIIVGLLIVWISWLAYALLARSGTRRTSPGMLLMGVRRVRVLGRTRVVLARDLAGAQTRLGLRIVIAVVAALLVCTAVTSFVDPYANWFVTNYRTANDVDSAQWAATEDVSGAIERVSSFYHDMLLGSSGASLSSYVRGGAVLQLPVFVRRAKAAGARLYRLDLVNSYGDVRYARGKADSTSDATVTVSVWEDDRNLKPPAKQRLVVFTVAKTVHIERGRRSGNAFFYSQLTSWSSDYWIVSIRRTNMTQ